MSTFRDMCNHYEAAFSNLLEKDGSFSVPQTNIQTL